MIQQSNTVRNLTHTGANTATGIGASLIGMYFSASGTSGMTVSGNTVSNLSNTNSSSSVIVYGMYYSGPASGTNIIYGNLFHSLTTASSSAGASVYALYINAGASSFYNNLISLGTGVSTNNIIEGIYENGLAGNNNNLYFNSVYIGGTAPASATAATYALYNNANTNTRNYTGNILCNSRSNTSGTAKHYAISISGITSLTVNYNDYYASGTGGILGYLGGDKNNLSLWKAATGQDANSWNINPAFTSPSASTPNLIPADGYYIPGPVISGITTDYSGTIRSSNSYYKPDIGAYEKNYLNKVVRWLGTISTDWAVAGNWDGGSVPGAADFVWIPAWGSNLNVHVTKAISSPAVTDKLTIYSGSTLTIDAGDALTVSSSVSNNAGNSGLVVASGGSLIQNSGSVGATVQQTISGWSDAVHGWHFLSAPVSSQAIDPAFTDPTPANYDFYSWWEPTNQWVNFKNSVTPPVWGTANVLGGITGNGNFIPGLGYLVAYSSTGTRSFSGILNKDNISVSDLSLNNGNNYGWHLLGNPYTSAVQWNDGNWALSNISTTAKIWNESGASYIDISAGGIIPALSGFMVEVTGNSNSITIPAASRTHSTTAWYKSADPPMIKLLASDPAGSTAQESIIRFIQGSTEGYDPEFDSHFLPGYAPQFYSVAGIENLSSNTLPNSGGTIEVPFDFIKNSSADFIIEAKKIQSVDGPVWLKDLKTGTSQELKSNPSYSFSSVDGDNPHRFILTFQNVGISEIHSSGLYSIKTDGNRVFINSRSGHGLGKVMIFNMPGQLLLTQDLQGSAHAQITLMVPTGYYLLKIEAAEGAQVSKIFIK